MSDADRLFAEVREHARQTALLASTASVLEWDERTYMPGAAGEYRAEQIAQLAGMAHARWVDERFGDNLTRLADQLHGDSTTDAGATVAELKRQYDKKTRLPQSLVEELARTSILGQQVWSEARRDDDFAHLRPVLEKLFDLKRAEAAALGYRDSIYDPLLDEFEPGASTAEVRAVLAALRDALTPLARAIAGSGRRPDVSLLERQYPVDAQREFAREAAARVGFDFARGRLDTTAHPFCTSLGPHDIRLTTRYNEREFGDAFFGTLHEAGHGLYEQGLPPDEFGLPLGEAMSLGIHESQSRLWENLVGRSRAFWEHMFPAARSAFSQALASTSLDDFYFAINDVRPSLIRVEADEVTYNLHIFVRFELEQALLADDLRVADLPAAWNEKYRDYLGLTPPSDAVGVLQDIHWSGGAIGYFPTYALGNLYAAQFFEQAESEVGPLNEQFRRGEFQPLLGWLRQKIHRHGRRMRAAELVQNVTGRPLSHEPLLRHLERKLRPLYGLN